MGKKGKIEEILKYAIYKGPEEIKRYKVTYREFNEYITVPLDDFLRKEQEVSGLKERAIPWHRISEIYKDDRLIFSRPRY